MATDPLANVITFDEGENIIGETGVYSEFPAMTPKYHPGDWYDAARTTQARMWLPFSSESAYQSYKSQLRERARNLVDALSTFIDGARGIGYIDFGLQQINETYQEKVQVSEVLSDGYIAHFFGQRAPTWSYSGFVINTEQDEWYDAWHILYEDAIRGTRLAEARIPLRLAYDTRVVSGSLVGMSTSFQAQNETYAMLQFQLLVKSVRYNPKKLLATQIQAPSTQVAQGQSALTSFATTVNGPVRTAMVAGLTAARENFQLENRINDDVRLGADTNEIKDKTDLDVQAAQQAIEDLDAELNDLDTFHEDEAAPVEGTGVDLEAAGITGEGVVDPFNTEAY